MLTLKFHIAVDGREVLKSASKANILYSKKIEVDNVILGKIIQPKRRHAAASTKIDAHLCLHSKLHNAILSHHSSRIPAPVDAIFPSTNLSTPQSVQSDNSESNCLPSLCNIHSHCEEKAPFSLKCLLLFTEEPMSAPVHVW